jgi:omega-6 fatty acid desaturase (delta-12 desaturase)
VTRVPADAGSGLSQALAPYQRSDVWRSVWQIANSLVPYLGLWILMVWGLSVSFWIPLALAPLAGGFMIRLFIIFHDCGHGSFFRSRRANEIVGFVTGVITLTPTHQWWRAHAIHHATAGDLDRRGVGDVWTMTVREYAAAPLWTRAAYRFFRNPAVLLTLGPVYSFVLMNRFAGPKAGKRERLSVDLTNVALAAIIVTLAATIGWKAYLTVHLLIFAFGTPVGVWLFYVQHQFEGVYWRRHEAWDYPDVGLRGSSYYRLPKLLQWFTGNIGFHHIHHLSPRIPNYFLERCHRETPELRDVPSISLRASLKCLSHRLWDEERGRLVGFRAVG